MSNPLAYVIWMAETDDEMQDPDGSGAVDCLIFVHLEDGQRCMDEYDGSDPVGRTIDPLFSLRPILEDLDKRKALSSNPTWLAGFEMAESIIKWRLR